MEDIFQQLANAFSDQTNKLTSVADKLQNLDIHSVANKTPRYFMTDVLDDAWDYEFEYLPKFDAETVLSTTHTIKSIEFDNFSMASDVAAPEDYSAVIILKKDSSVTTLEDLIVNAQSDYTGTKVHLLNSGLDISAYSIIHLFLFYDGFGYCVLAAGYEMT